jgi:uncharacterized protein (TIGR00369 family)
MSQVTPNARYPEGPDDLADADSLRALSGRAFLEAMRDGRLPAAPMARALNFGLSEVEEGRVVFLGAPGFDHYNPIGSLHGGWYGAILDSAMGCAIHSALPAGRGYTTLEYKVNLLRAVPLDAGPLRAEGETVHVGRRTATAEGRLVDPATGRVHATGSTTCLVFEIV